MKYPSPILKPYALTRFFKATFIAGILPVFLLLLSIQSGRAGSATGNMNPTSGDFLILNPSFSLPTPRFPNTFPDRQPHRAGSTRSGAENPPQHESQLQLARPGRATAKVAVVVTSNGRCSKDREWQRSFRQKRPSPTTNFPAIPTP